MTSPAQAPNERVIEIAVAGEGEVLFRFIDQSGRTLLQERIVVSGSATVEGRRVIALAIDTPKGRVAVAPVLVRKSNPGQRVLFNGEETSRFTRARCEEIGCTTDIAAEAERGHAPAIGRADAPVLLNDDQLLKKIFAGATRNESSESQ